MNTSAPSVATELANLKEQMRVLEARVTNTESSESDMTVAADSDEIKKLQLSLLLPEPLGTSFSGLAPGMSRIYGSRSPFAFGGFAEINYESVSTGSNTTDTVRFNPYFAWRFSENLIFNSGLTFTDGGANQGTGAAQVNFAYLDFLTGNEGGVRVGNVLLPIGLTNYRPEPTLFLTVNRPHPEMTIIPSTWHENGILGFGRIENVLIQAGVVSGGDASKYETKSWIAQGRQNGANARAEDPAAVFRTEVLTASTDFGLSLYYGNSSQGDSRYGSATVFLGEVHGEARTERFSVKALYSEGSLSDTGQIFAANGRAIGSRARGGYITASYDLLPRLAPFAKSLIDTPVMPGWRELPVFASWEYDNPVSEPAEGQPSTNDYSTSRLIFGVNYKPHQQVVVKSDFVNESRGTGETVRYIEVGVAAVF